MQIGTNMRIASFNYNGKRIDLIPSQMPHQDEGAYVKELSDGLRAILEIEENERFFSVLLRFEHGGSTPSGQISRVRTLDIEIPAGGTRVTWRSFTGDSNGEASYNPLEKVLNAGDMLHVEPTGGRSCNTTGFPFFDVECAGRAYAFGIGWTGQWMQEVSCTDAEVSVEIGLPDADFYLNPGESVRAPMALIVEDADSASVRRAFRRVMLADFSPRGEDGRPLAVPAALQPFDRYFYTPTYYKHGRPDWATENGQKQCVDAALACKSFDTLWLDAAWFKEGFPNGVGNYSFAPGFPNGLKPVTDYAHEKGLQFVLWFEPERIDCHSETFRDHRDMLLECENCAPNYLFNLADDRARAWLKDTLISFIRDNGIDVYRQDFNFEPLPYWQANDEPGRKGILEMKYVAGLYDLWDSLRAAFPGMLIDNCSSGGRRIDVETCRRSIPLWRSDTGCAPVSAERRGHTWSQNHILALTQYIPCHACAAWEPEAYLIRSAQSGGIACTFDVLNPAFDYDMAQKVLGEVEAHRKYWTGDFYPLTGITNSEEVWAAWQLVKGGDGVVYAFRRDHCEQEECTLNLQAIDAEAQYEVTVTDEMMNAESRILSGEELMKLTVRCEKARQSVSVEYRRKA